MDKIDLIDRAAVVEKLLKEAKESVDDQTLSPLERATMCDFIRYAVKRINEAPTVDAAPVRRGGCEYCKGLKRVSYQESHSVKLYINSFVDARTIEVEANKCPPSLGCGLSNIPVRAAFIINFCPNCGADMRPKTKEE